MGGFSFPFQNGPFNNKTGGFFPQMPTSGSGSMRRPPVSTTGPVGQMPPGMPQKMHETPEQQKNRNRMREGMGGGIPTGGGMNQGGGMGQSRLGGFNLPGGNVSLQNILPMLQAGMGGGIQPPMQQPSIFNPLDRMKPMREPMAY